MGKKTIVPKKIILGGFCLALTISQTCIPSAMASSYNMTDVTYPYYAFVEDEAHPWSTVWDALDSEGTIGWSDEFFNEPSPGDHPELRAASYALALAGYENAADGYPYDDDLPPYSKLTGLLDQMGFSDYQSWDVASEEDGHSMGATIGHKTLAGGQKLLVIAPRNYNYMNEWLSNFNVGTTGDHAGFAESADRIVSYLNEYLQNHDFADYKLWVVGYSRGGAVIDLLAKKINENISSYQLNEDDFYVYTFGAPRASITETNYANIHDVKDGNDLLLGYVFPKLWGFYNTGSYEEIHPADLEIPTSVVDISDLANSTTAINVLMSNQSIATDVGTMNGREFMDAWIQFVTENGLTREYFDTEVKDPLSAVMKAYQQRTLDKQGDFTNFFKDTSKGLAGMVAGNGLYDLMNNYGGDLSIFPVYLDLVKVMKGTAVDADVEELITILTDYMGEYNDYEEKLGEVPVVTELEFAIIKENLPKLVKALAPIIIADAKYTQETFGEDYSLYYTYTLASNAEKLVIGHIPESIMPILKSLIPADDEDDDPSDGDDEEEYSPTVPNTGHQTNRYEEQKSKAVVLPVATGAIVMLFIVGYALKKRRTHKK
ncbi:hypothetical protein IJG79_00225 [Candidatus Saccharibacteria bacterium]|nr:hypothetical protein [Candidatus Saccharibacteria bacterium]